MILYNAIGAVEEVPAYFDLLRNRPRLPEDGLNILISFPYIRGQISRLIELRQQGFISRLFLDAGTFTINVRGATNPLPPPRFSEYVQYVKLYGDQFDYFAAYDQDFADPDLNVHNLLRMEKLLPDNLRSKMIPVVHEREDKAHAEFEDLAALGYDYIAVGSQPAIKKENWKKIETVIQAAKQQGRILKAHTFGSMSFKKLSERRPYSADSSTFAKTGAQESMLYWNPESNTLDEVRLLDLSDPEMAVVDKRLPWLQKHDQYLMTIYNGISKDRLINHTPTRHIVNFYALQQMERYFTSLPEPVPD